MKCEESANTLHKNQSCVSHCLSTLCNLKRDHATRGVVSLTCHVTPFTSVRRSRAHILLQEPNCEWFVCFCIVRGFYLKDFFEHLHSVLVCLIKRRSFKPSVCFFFLPLSRRWSTEAETPTPDHVRKARPHDLPAVANCCLGNDPLGSVSEDLMTLSLYAVASAWDRSGRNYLHQWRWRDKPVFASPVCVMNTRETSAVANGRRTRRTEVTCFLCYRCPLAVMEGRSSVWCWIIRQNGQTVPEQVADDVSVAGIVYRSLLVSLFRIIDIYTEYYSIVFVSWVFYILFYFLYTLNVTSNWLNSLDIMSSFFFFFFVWPESAASVIWPQYATTVIWPEHATTVIWPEHATTVIWPEHATTLIWPEHATTVIWPEHATSVSWPQRATSLIWPQHATFLLWLEHATSLIWPEHAASLSWLEQATAVIWPEQATAVIWPEQATAVIWPAQATAVIWLEQATAVIWPEQATAVIWPEYATTEVQDKDATQPWSSLNM